MTCVVSKSDIIKTVRGALEHDPRINPHRYPIRITVSAGAVVLEGDVADIAAKKLALEHAAAVDDVQGVIDRLRVVPAQYRSDGAIRNSLVGLLLRQAELRACAIRVRDREHVETLREAAAENGGEIEAAITDGVITLEGSVASLSHKRIAGVLGWWTPGCRDVVNSLDVWPDEKDGDDEVLDALRLVLEMDPMVDPSQIRASCRDYVLTLDGCVRSEQEKRQAELDAWYLFAVDRVVNKIEVRC